jgi:perosamine synthetase
VTAKSTSFIPLVSPWLPDECAGAVHDQVRSGFIGPGRTTADFCATLAAFVGAERALATVSGTVALTVAARALDLQPQDEILLPAYGVISTINAFAVAGLRPRLVDIDRMTGCVSVQGLAEACTPATRAVCFVDFSGHTGQVAEAAAWCAERGLPLIEDAAGALGHRIGNRSAGTAGDVGIYSFSVPKVVTTGQGGALIAKRNDVFERAAAYIDHGDLEWRRTNLNRSIGTNLRFTDIQAAVGLVQLRQFDARLARRRALHDAMRSVLGDLLYRVPGGEAPLHNIVFSAKPDDLVRRLNDADIGAVRQYRTIAQHPAYRALADRAFPNADYWTDSAVYLPFGMAMTTDDARRVAEEAKRSGLLRAHE